ncbi:GTPase domain-containing protein [Pseudomonas sp. gcc21]|uniref:GTPase n=1 Tax=Pseudomonas sp. gcc21 TaxID=2726989 RepID=UPI001452712E|nr:GTPase domain-containing protein [Pseudomonas sp. gcc21]QJD58411.1 GTPase domain-containing protein [Pseudomonas sp. gcc21]
MTEANVNILVVGKSGAGKSSFCNYIFNESVFATGNGRPVTGWSDHFISSSVQYEDFILNLFDTVGIEATNLVKWELLLDQFLEERSPSSETMPQEWLHSAIYVLNAASARIEDAELRLINKLNYRNFPVQVVLTMCDKAKPEEILAMQACLEASCPGISVSQVCSVAIRKRSGLSTKFGREAVLDSLVSGLDTELAGALINAVCDRLQLEITVGKKACITALSESELSLFNMMRGFIQQGDSFDMDTLLGFDFDNLLSVESAQFNEMNKSIDSFLHALGKRSRSKITTSEIVANIRQRVDSAMEDAGTAFEERLNSEVNTLENGDFWQALAAASRISMVVARLKPFMKTEMGAVLDKAYNEVDIQRSAAHQVLSLMNPRRKL